VVPSREEIARTVVKLLVDQIASGGSGQPPVEIVAQYTIAGRRTCETPKNTSTTNHVNHGAGRPPLRSTPNECDNQNRPLRRPGESAQAWVTTHCEHQAWVLVIVATLT